jgi:hypothetical protein
VDSAAERRQIEGRTGPRQNRVTPFGEIVASPERGTIMGNRGILHDALGRIRRPWATRAWICCVLEFRGRRDPVMAPGHYTRLFFLDEPTALAAGHRPCAYCRRPAYLAFRDAWASANADRGLGPTPRATEMDRVINDERIGPGGSKRLHRARLSDLPDGVILVLDTAEQSPDNHLVLGHDDREAWVLRNRFRHDPHGPPAHDLPAFLVWRGTHWRWTPGGYQEAARLPDGSVFALTPPSIVGALRAGYRPEPPAGLG